MASGTKPQAGGCELQASGTKPGPGQCEPGGCKPEPGNVGLRFSGPMVSQREFEEAMKHWPEEPESFHDPSQEAEDQAPPGHVLVWDFLSPLQKRILQQNPRARDGLQSCSPPVPKVSGLPGPKSK